MDVTFTNVLEGARQYFQGLPAGSGSTASPVYPEGHNRNENEQNPGEMPPSSTAYWPQAQEQQRKLTPVQHNSDPSRPQQHAQYMPNVPNDPNRLTQYQNSYQEPPTSQTQFQFSRPQSREAPSNHPHQQMQYQPHIASSATYHQIASPSRIQTSRPQEPQVIHPPQSSQSYQNYPHSRYYPVQAQAKPVTTPSNTYSAASNQDYQTTQNAAYYKHSYTPHTQSQTPNIQYSAPSTSIQRHIPISSQHETFRTTHNLPPIAALSAVNYHPRSNKEPARSNMTRPRTSVLPTSSSQQHTAISNASSIIQNTSSLPYSSGSYSEYRNVPTYTNQQQASSNYQYPTATTQSYTHVIVTSSTTPSSYTATHQSSNQYYHSPKANPTPPPPRNQPPSNILSNHQSNIPQAPQNFDRNVNGRLAPVIKQKRESPLDLSVKTVRTSADSTLDDAENDARIKFYHANRPSAHSSISAHSYPQYDVNSFQRNLTQRSSQMQQSASVPKVEFHPNFNIPSLNHHPPRNFAPEAQRSSVVVPDKAHSGNRGFEKTYPPNYQPNIANRYPTVPIPSAHINSHLPQKKHDGIPRIDFPSPNNKQSNSYGSQAGHDINKKRLAEAGPSVIPKKVPKVDAWRQSIDQEIDQRLSSYKQEQQQKYNPLAMKSLVLNGTFPPATTEKKKDVFPVRQTPYQNVPQQPFSNYHPQSSHNQTYVPSATSHQYPGYTPGFTNQQAVYPYPLSRSNSSSSMYTAKNNMGGGADKRVLSLLRNSLEVKGQKKLEQSKIHESAHARSDVQHPSTDVTAPIQPKPGFINRNNVSPFTPTSFPDNSGMAMYKFHMPKAIDSVNYDTETKSNLTIDVKSNDEIQTIISNNATNNEYDGLAALVAARIRTKGELKQGGLTSTASNNNSMQQLFMENQLISPFKQETSSAFGSSSTNTSVSPPKYLKERASLVPPRRRLFSRTEDDPGSNNVPHRDKSGLRSSSETSVFDFPDSDSENEMEKKSLHAMRRDRKTTVKPAPNADIKIDSPRPLSPIDDIFAQVCDNFMEQLKSGSCKKKGRRKKLEPEVIAKLESATKENPLESTDKVVIKTEPVDIVIENQENDKKLEIEEPAKEEPAVRKSEELIIKLETMESPYKNNDLEISENKKKNVKRRVILSSDSDNENVNAEAKIEIKQEVVKVDDDKAEHTVTKTELPIIAPPAKKPSFGDGSDFYPGWEESVYKYKRSLRMPPSLIQVTRPPQFHRLSTSLPDLDPTPHSPTPSLTADNPESAKKLQKVKSEPMDSDVDSNCSFNLFSKHNSYDSEGGSSIKSLPNIAKESNSILDKLLEKYGGKKRRKYKKKDDVNPKIIPKSENPVELLPTPSLEVQNKQNDKKLQTPVIKSESALLGFRKKTLDNYKDEFIKSASNLISKNKFATIVLKSRTRKETRVLKQRATIKEVFGDDRPASAPPITCVNNIHIKEEIEEPTEEKAKEADATEDKLDDDQTFQSDLVDTKLMLKNKLLNRGKKLTDLPNHETDKKIKTEIEEEPEEDIMKDILIKRDPEIKSETPSIDDEGSISGKKKSKLRSMRRKFSSGFDYIRKKKKVKKEIETENTTVKVKRRGAPAKASPESVQDIQKEIKTWVLNKGIGETHLHRAARLGYTDITAYCLEKMECHPSPKDNAGYTPLHEACSRGHLDIAKLLLLYGANASESAQGGIRPLHEAVENGFVEIVRLLLSYGADPNLATYSGLTPLALAKDDVTLQLLKAHINDLEGVPDAPWYFKGVASKNDIYETGYDILEDTPDPDPISEDEDIEFEMSEALLPNLYTLRGEPPNDRWILLQDLSSLLKIKSRDALLKQISPPSSSNSPISFKSVLRELKMTDFLEQAHCCQFLNAGEKINTRASKIALVKYTDKVKELLNVENVVITAR